MFKITSNGGTRRRRKSKFEVDMQDKFKPIECNDGDVLDFGDNTYKVAKLKQAINTSSNSALEFTLNQQLSGQGVKIKQSPNVNWFHLGIDCEILTLGSQSWKKGKVKIKISVEFYVEEEDVQITIAVLDPVRYNFDLSPNLSPKRREALNFSPFPLREGG